MFKWFEPVWGRFIPCVLDILSAINRWIRSKERPSINWFWEDFKRPSMRGARRGVCLPPHIVRTASDRLDRRQQPVVFFLDHCVALAGACLQAGPVQHLDAPA